MYTLKIKHDTFLKLSNKHSGDLGANEKCAIVAGLELPVSSWALEGNHYRVAFGLDKEGQQITFPAGGRRKNTWLIFSTHAEIVKDGKIVRVHSSTAPLGKYWLRCTPAGQRDEWGCLQFRLDRMRDTVVLDRVIVISGAPYANILHPTDDYSGSMAPCPEGVYNLGPVERGWFGASIGAIAIELMVQERYRANDRSLIFIHEDANRDYAPGSAGCLCPVSASDMEQVAAWFSAARPDSLVMDCGLGFLQSR